MDVWGLSPAALCVLCQTPPRVFRGGTVAGCGPAVGAPGRQHDHQLPPEAANQAGQVRRQGGKPSLPGAAARTPAVLVQERPHLRDHRMVLGET